MCLSFKYEGFQYCLRMDGGGEKHDEWYVMIELVE